MIVVDASVWASNLLPDDVNYSQSHAWFATVPLDEELFEPRLLLVEVGATLARRLNDVEVAREAVEFISTYPGLVLMSMTDELVDEAVSVASELRLRAGDAVYVALARLTGARLVSWDRQQLTRAASTVETSSPADDLQSTR